MVISYECGRPNIGRRKSYPHIAIMDGENNPGSLSHCHTVHLLESDLSSLQEVLAEGGLGKDLPLRLLWLAHDERAALHVLQHGLVHLCTCTCDKVLHIGTPNVSQDLTWTEKVAKSKTKMALLKRSRSQRPIEGEGRTRAYFFDVIVLQGLSRT